MTLVFFTPKTWSPKLVANVSNMVQIPMDMKEICCSTMRFPFLLIIGRSARLPETKRPIPELTPIHIMS